MPFLLQSRCVKRSSSWRKRRANTSCERRLCWPRQTIRSSSSSSTHSKTRIACVSIHSYSYTVPRYSGYISVVRLNLCLYVAFFFFFFFAVTVFRFALTLNQTFFPSFFKMWGCSFSPHELGLAIGKINEEWNGGTFCNVRTGDHWLDEHNKWTWCICCC